MKDGRRWQLGTAADVEWIRDGTAPGLEITAAIPPRFERYATLVLPKQEQELVRQEQALLRLLATVGEQPWFLGYLLTGADDVVFAHAPTVTVYSDWEYLLVQAGPREAGAWRSESGSRGRLPELMFPPGRDWLVSTLWDDQWRCIGGPAALLERMAEDDELAPRLRTVAPTGDATPPGHRAL